MQNNHRKFWTDKEFDAKLYDEFLNGKPTIHNLVNCMTLITGYNNLNPDDISQNPKYLRRMIEFIEYYSDKKIFPSDTDCIIGSTMQYYHPIFTFCEIIRVGNYKIKDEKLDLQKIDPLLVIDIMIDHGYEPH